jgi:hypothetical protein
MAVNSSLGRKLITRMAWLPVSATYATTGVGAPACHEHVACASEVASMARPVGLRKSAFEPVPSAKPAVAPSAPPPATATVRPLLGATELVDVRSPTSAKASCTARMRWLPASEKSAACHTAEYVHLQAPQL